MRHHLLKSLVSVGLCTVISLASMPAARAQNVPAHMNLVVVEGEGATSGVRQRVARDPVVKLEDDDKRPIAGAAVVFALPVSGPSGEFINGTKNLTTVTDENGLAIARGLKTNDVPGKLQIYVTAAYRGLRARTLITQIVEAAPGSKTASPELRTSKSLYFGRNKTAPSPISISAGTVAFGSPR
jgi:hypothetical protein